MHINRSSFFAAIALSFTLACSAQSPKSTPPYPTHLPYAFSNFVWWSDADLRAQLKKRIPSLGDEIAPTKPVEAHLRDALKAILREKGITADVMSEDPSPWSLTAKTAPGAPIPAIVFSILNPQILVDRVMISGAPETEIDTLNKSFGNRSGHEYSSRQEWVPRSETERQLQQDGYLEASAEVSHDAPRREGDHYLVNLVVAAISGPRYSVAAITGDGGPLLQGRDLSSFFRLNSGDVAVGGPRGDLALQLQGLYERYGYADVVVQAPPVLDREHAQVSYNFSVTPGPLYHLRSLTIHNLDSGQESKVRRLLGLQPGDPYNNLAVSYLSNKVREDSSLNGYKFTFSPVKDQADVVIDLTLDFFKNTDSPSVPAR